MENYTISDFQSNMPMRCRMERLSHDRLKMHDYFEVTMVVSGNCLVTIGEDLYHLESGGIFCVNPHTLHELRSADCVVVTIHFDQTVFEQTLPSPFHPQFFCVSSVQNNPEAFDRIRSLVAQVVQNNVNKLSGYELRNWSMIYQLMDVLYNNFRLHSSEAQEARNHKYAKRMQQISRIVREHYMESPSLQDISDAVHLSVPYLSKFFTEQFGMNFLSYLNQYRLNHAVHELVHTDKNIDDIALESGFSSSHAFVTAFRKEFDMLPNVYRRQARAVPDNENLVEEQHNYIASLSQYLHEDRGRAVITPAREALVQIALAPGKETPGQGTNAAAKETTGQEATVSSAAKEAQSGVTQKAGGSSIRKTTPPSGQNAVSFSSHTYPLRNTWKTMLTVGTAQDLLLSNIQDMVRRAQREIGFSYIRVNGILSDGLLVFSKDEKGNAQYSFTYVDLVLDFLLSVGLKPWIQLSYMPRLLALHPDKLLFNDIVSQPKSNKEWCALVRAFLMHIRNRYGAAEAASWWYSVWNQPNTSKTLFGFDQPEEFMLFYRDTVQCIRSVDPDLRIALPPSYYLTGGDYRNPYMDFLPWTKENDCYPDALSFAYYDMKFLKTESQTRETFGFPYAMRLSENPDSFRDFVMQLALEKRNLGIPKMPVYLTEWNNTPSQQDLLNDTCYKACYIVKNILENYDRLESFAFWSLCDLMRDALLPGEPFFGGGGLFTPDGLPKASYYAYVLLSKLGKSLVARGSGYFMTQGKGAYQLLLYHYEHFTGLYASGELFDMTRTKRYTVFAQQDPVAVQVVLSGLREGDYTITEMFINRHAGSVYDAWVEMGAPEVITPDAKAYLRQVRPGYHEHTVHVGDDGVLELEVTMELLEVRLVTLTLAGE